MKLPYKMNESIATAMSSVYPDLSILTFTTFFVRGIKDQDGNFVEGGMIPRFVSIYSEDKKQAGIATELVKRIFSDQIDYDLSEEGPLLTSEDEQDSILMHRRSRVIKASDLITILEKSLEDNDYGRCYDFLLKSTLFLEIKTIKDENGTSYQARTYFRPSTADIIADTGPLLYPSISLAVERILNSPHCPYDSSIDHNFDTCFIESELFRGEISPPKDSNEFIELINKNLMALK